LSLRSGAKQCGTHGQAQWLARLKRCTCCSPRGGSGPKHGVAALAAHQAAAHEDRRRRRPLAGTATPPSPFEAVSKQVPDAHMRVILLRLVR